MKCTYKTIPSIPACYALPDMKLVRAGFLWHTKQYNRLENLRDKCLEKGMIINYEARYRNFYWLI